MNINTILIDRYQLQQKLSQKAGRLTFLALDLHSQDLVIIKILRFNLDFQWDDLKLFEREAATLKNLNHPAIPKYLDYFEIEEADARGFALVQTYIDAPSIETVVKKGRKFTETEVIELADRLLTILTYLHEQNPPVIHRDIKPSNILLTNRSGNSIGDVYLVDFGSVQTVASKDGGTITIVGSYGYIPLEQFGGQTKTASDLYSLGMTIIYLITGIHPAELPQVNGQVKFQAEISNKLSRWLEKMTQPHLDKRFDSAKLAQISLKSHDGSYGDFVDIKPVDCRITMSRNSDCLEFTFPNLNVRKMSKFMFIIRMFSRTISSFEMIISLLPGLVFMSGLFVHVMLIFSVPVWATWGYHLLFFLLYTLPFFIFCCAFTSESLVFVRANISKIKEACAIKKYATISISHDKITQFNHSSLKNNKKKPSQVELSSNINLITYTPERNFYVHPTLSIYAGSSQFLIGNGLSHGELWWLGKELSDFLNLELQVIPNPVYIYPLKLQREDSQ